MPSDVAKWLLALPDADFRDIVTRDCAGALDDEASQGLRETPVLSRWIKALDAMTSEARAAGSASPASMPQRRAEAARQQEAGRTGTSNGARKRAAGTVALDRLVAAHPDEFRQYLDQAHAELDTPAEGVLRVRRLAAAGLTWRTATDFAERKWPEGDLTAGVRLIVTSEAGPGD